MGAEPEQAVLRHQRPAEFDPQDGVGGALCLGEMGQNRIGGKLLKIRRKVEQNIHFVSNHNCILFRYSHTEKVGKE